MAKKKSKVSTTPKRRRKRRSPDEIINDLQEEIRRVRARAKARELKESPSIKAAFSAVKAIDKGLDAAAEENNALLRHALADARKAIAKYLEDQGLKLGKANLPKGPRPKPQ